VCWDKIFKILEIDIMKPKKTTLKKIEIMYGNPLNTQKKSLYDLKTSFIC
jgi:hypothetical protein